MPFGQLVVGPPGSGKSTYCHGMHQFLTALNRPVHIVNLDPANETLPYPCSLSISSLVTLQDAMDEFGLGPNGAMLYCMEYLEENFDWLVEELDKLEGGYFIFDIAGQVELSTNHGSLTRIMDRLRKLDYRLAAVHLSDASYLTDASKYISVLLTSLRTMLQLEMPHINVLSKMDIITQFGDLPFNLDFYTEVQDLSQLSILLDKDPRLSKFGDLNRAICEIVEDFGLVGFETLAVEDKKSMLHLLKILDKATGYIFIPPTQPSSSSATDGSPADLFQPSSSSSRTPNADALFGSIAGRIPGRDIGDIQERWVDRKEEFDEWEREEWKKEGEEAKRVAAAAVGKRRGGME
ncbi:Predicted GTPase [Phaffia rhodozyma]|uniref:GPN-loop GTPase 2 n=1 Tax=Phaffia rhodozyma TaxID=264483 RepID=A0A0F7SSD9_PHARH|nr:Predicted GTPase [Phaffia rhodozyma]